MTPFEDDLITDIGSSKSLVEVANGNIVKAPKKGLHSYELSMSKLTKHLIFSWKMFYMSLEVPVFESFGPFMSNLNGYG